MRESIRHLAVDILTQVNDGRSFASPLLDSCLDAYRLSATPDGKLLTYLVYGALRHRGYLDWITTKLYRGNFRNLDERIKNILRISVFQLKFSDRLPSFAVVDEAVKITQIISPGKSGLVNAVLRNFLRQDKNIPFPPLRKNTAEYISLFHSHPLWVVKEWLSALGEQNTVALCTANNQIPPFTLRANTLKISPDKLSKNLRPQGFITTTTVYSPDGLIIVQSDQTIQKTEAFYQGLLRLQDEGSQCIPYLINPKKNESILDVCAGTGGKATHLAAIINNQGHIVAIDNDPEKISELKKEATRMGITAIDSRMADVSANLPEEFHERFDHVLVDAPCSGTGTLRRNPEIKWRLAPSDINKSTVIQNKILCNASHAVKRGGQLIYCTCSLLSKENEHIINTFLAKNKHFLLCKPPSSINQSLIDSKHFYRTYPHIHNMDGFFAAVLRRD